MYKYMNAIANPQPYKLVNNGPVKENIIKRNIDLPRIIRYPNLMGGILLDLLLQGLW